MKALEALLDYEQADEDGVMVLASRQAIHEVAEEIKGLRNDNVCLVSGLSWAVGALKGLGHGDGYAKNTLERFLGRVGSSVSATTAEDGK